MIQDFTKLEVGTEVEDGVIELCPGCTRPGLKQLHRKSDTEGLLVYVHSLRISPEGAEWAVESDQHAFAATLKPPTA
jgi:hypothetical protein